MEGWGSQGRIDPFKEIYDVSCSIPSHGPLEIICTPDCFPNYDPHGDLSRARDQHGCDGPDSEGLLEVRNERDTDSAFITLVPWYGEKEQGDRDEEPLHYTLWICGNAQKSRYTYFRRHRCVVVKRINVRGNCWSEASISCALSPLQLGLTRDPSVFSALSLLGSSRLGLTVSAKSTTIEFNDLIYMSSQRAGSFCSYHSTKSGSRKSLKKSHRSSRRTPTPHLPSLSTNASPLFLCRPGRKRCRTSTLCSARRSGSS